MPRRQCLFCHFMWTRPHKIQTHLVTDHAEIFAAEMLEEIKALRGRRVIEFVDGVEATLQSLLQA